MSLPIVDDTQHDGGRVSPDDFAGQAGREKADSLPKASQLTEGNGIKGPESGSQPTSHTANHQRNFHRSHKKTKKRTSIPTLLASCALWIVSSRVGNLHPLVWEIT